MTRIIRFPRVFVTPIDPRKPISALALKLLAIGAVIPLPTRK